MAPRRTCKALNSKGGPCGAPPRLESDYCVFHDPELAEIVQSARSAGGTRRKREVTLAVAYDFQGLSSVEEIRRLVEVAVFDALGLESSVAKVRALGYLAQVSLSLLEKGELEERVAAIEAAMGPRVVKLEGRRR